jgi:hypothetical protein
MTQLASPKIKELFDVVVWTWCLGFRVSWFHKSDEILMEKIAFFPIQSQLQLPLLDIFSAQ